jgi:WD40 repeat protein
MPIVFSETIHRVTLPEVPLALDFSNDGSLLAVAITGYQRSCSIQVYSVEDGSLVAEFGADALQGRGVAFSEDGRLLYFLVQNVEGNFDLYKVSLNGGSPDHIAPYGIGESCHSLIRNCSGTLLAVVGNAIEVWDTEIQEVVRFIKGASQEKRVFAAFSADGPYIYTYGTVEGAVVQFDLAENQQLTRWQAPQPFGKQVVVSPSGEFLAAVGWGIEGVFIYNTVSGERFQPSFYNESAITGLFTFSFDNSLLINLSGGGANAERLLTGECIKGPKFPRSRQAAIASAWEAPVVAYAHEDKSLVWLHLVEE